MNSPARRMLTPWDALLTVPNGYIGEIVAGELVMLPRPAPAHAESSSRLGVLIGGPYDFGFGGPGGWVLLDEPRIAFFDDIRVPDLAGWQRDRYRRPERGPYTVVPDWICEILSPSTAISDRAEKMPLYAAAGVKHMWLIDPKAQLLEVYRLQASQEGNQWLLLGVHRAGEKVHAEPFDAVALDLGLLWRPLGGESGADEV